MDKHIAMGVFVGGIFAATIASIAARRPRCRWFCTTGVRFGCRPVYRRLDRCGFAILAAEEKRKGRSRRAQPKRGTRAGVTASTVN
jgi:hypothetical protein